MKISVECLTVKDGKMREIEYLGEIYEVGVKSEVPVLKQELKKEMKKYRKKYRRKHNGGEITYNKKYSTWIKREELDKVTLAINKVAYGYTPNAETITAETHLRRHRVLAILDYMKGEGLVNEKRIGVKRTYHPVVRVGN